MEVRRLQPEDASVVVAFLHEHLESSLFLLSNLRKGGVVFRGRPYQAEYIGVFRETTLIGLAAHTWLDTLLLQAPYLEALNLLEGALSRLLSRPLRGLLGPRDQCLELMERLSLDRSSATLDLDEPMYSLELSRLRRPAQLEDSGLRVRSTNPSDLKQLSRWRLGYLIDVMNYPPSAKLELRAAAEVRAAHREGRAFVLEDRHQVVAYCAYNATIPEAVQIGGIWTPGELRGRGYGRAATAGALEYARDVLGHRQAVSMIDDGNRAALAACESLGFQRMGRYSFTLWDRA